MIVVFVAAALLIALGVKAAIEAEKRRKRRIVDMGELAASRGLSFTTARDTGHDEHYPHFELFRQGFDRYAYNTMAGEVELDMMRLRCKAGDFHYKTRETYTTSSGKGHTTRTRIVPHHFSYLIMELPFEGVPDMLIRREGLFDKLASAFGHNDIDFESAEFSRRYFVRCPSRKFAYDIIHPRMIEFLLASAPGLVDMENGRICLCDAHEVWPAPVFGQKLDWTRAYLSRWPGFVVEELARGRSA